MTATIPILQPPATMLLGPPGSGKTDVLATLLSAGLEVFDIITEPDGVGSLLDSCTRRRIPMDKLHWTTCMPAVVNLTALEDMTKTISNNSYEGIASIKSGVGKSDTRAPAMKMLDALGNFHCERTGLDYGSFTQWEEDRCLVLDSLSGLSLIAMALTIGFKPAAHQGEWGVAMNYVEQLLLKITADRRCFFVITGHLERETNEVSGSIQLMASTLGRKLAPKLPRFFSEVILAKRTVANGRATFTWATVDPQMDLKNRSLPIGQDLTPDFKPIVDAYLRRKTLAGNVPQSQTSVPQPSAPPPVAQTAPMKPSAATYGVAKP